MKTFLILQILITASYVGALYAGAPVWVMLAMTAVDFLAYYQGRNSMR